MNPYTTPRLLSFALLLALAPAARAVEDIPQFRSVLIDGQTNLFSLADATGAGRWVKLGKPSTAGNSLPSIPPPSASPSPATAPPASWASPTAAWATPPLP